MSIIIKSGNTADLASVKPASTAAVATDPALVVAISPNNSLSISGTVTSNIGTTNGLALDATLTGGTAKTQLVGGATAKVLAASTSAVATDPALVVAISPNNSITANATLSAETTKVIGTVNVSAGQSITANAGTGTMAVSAASLPLPAGASTAAKQPALGTAGAASADVLTVQGVASMTALKVDGSAVTQPVSGTVAVSGSVAVTGPLTDTQLRASAVPVSLTSTTVTGSVTANAGTNLNTSALALDATLTGGAAKAIARTAAKGTTIAADLTSSPVDANTQALHVAITGTPTVTVGNASLAVTGTFFQGTQPVSAASLPLPTGASTAAKQPALGTAGTASADVLTVQGIASMTALKIDGSAVTQPVSGTVTANIGTTNGLALDATLTGGTAKTQLVGGATAKVLAASTAAVATDPALVVAISPNNSVAVTGTFFQGTQPVSIAASVAVTGPLTDTQLRASAVPVSGTVSANATLSAETTKVIGTVNVSAGQSITANIGTTNGLALDATLAKLTVAQSAALGTNTLAMVGGSVTTAAPSYTTGNINPLSLTTAGLLRIDGSGVTQPVSGTVTSNIGTTNGLALDATLTGGTAKMQLVGGAIAKVLAASTAPAATDPALVVSISPNSIAIGPADVTASGALGALNATVQVSIVGLNGAGFQLAAGTLIGTIIAEVSFDAGTTWNQTFFDDPTTSNKVASIVFGSANTATARTIVTAGGASLARLRVSAFTSGTANITVRSSQVNDPSIIAAGAPGAIPPPVALLMGGTDGANFRALSTDIGGRAIVSVVDGQKTTYSASATNITAAATATDVFTITGSATKTIRIFKIRLSGVQTTGGLVSVLMLKRSTANTAGTSTASTGVPHDSNNAAATATVVSYTANPTTGTLVGNIRSDKFLVASPTATSNQPGLLYDFGNRPGQAIVLRGVGQVFALNLNAATVTGGSFSYAIEWTEE